tara:strand:- start:330 stop:896 length:567 start_codon:yes stop_codon:yes gene_type:complete
MGHFLYVFIMLVFIAQAWTSDMPLIEIEESKYNVEPFPKVIVMETPSAEVPEENLRIYHPLLGSPLIDVAHYENNIYAITLYETIDIKFVERQRQFLLKNLTVLYPLRKPCQPNKKGQLLDYVSEQQQRLRTASQKFFISLGAFIGWCQNEDPNFLEQGQKCFNKMLAYQQECQKRLQRWQNEFTETE